MEIVIETDFDILYIRAINKLMDDDWNPPGGGGGSKGALWKVLLLSDVERLTGING